MRPVKQSLDNFRLESSLEKRSAENIVFLSFLFMPVHLIDQQEATWHERRTTV